jgi:hypothetical protein
MSVFYFVMELRAYQKEGIACIERICSSFEMSFEDAS